MNHIQTKEGKYLYALYDLCKSNRISSSQKGDLKDLLIQRDQKVYSILDSYISSQDYQEFINGIVEIAQEFSDDSQTVRSVPSFYKSKRPKPVIIREMTKIQGCRSQEYLDKLQIKQGNQRNSSYMLETEESSRKRLSGAENYKNDLFQSDLIRVQAM